MYGYFDVDGSFLRKNEKRIFSAYYCRLCYCLWNKGGQAARFLTTYDATVYNLVLAIAGRDTKPPNFACERIKTTHKNYFKDDPMGNLIADLSILGFAVKIKDDETDGDTLKALIARLFFGGVINKTIGKHQALYEQSYAAIVKMDELQRANAPIEEVLAAYGYAMESSFRYFFDIEDKYFYCINRIARWIFLIDMIDDYDEDVKKKHYNSLIREGITTVNELFEKHYTELISLIRNEIEGLKEALDDIENDKTEWVVLNKLVRHSMATLIPDVLNGKDIDFHYFSDTCSKNLKNLEEKRVRKKYEKDPNYYKGN